MKKAILLAAYGSSNPQGKQGLDHFESLCRDRFPGIPIRWAFTSSLQRDRLARQRKKSDSVGKALMRLHYEQFTSVAVQPLQIIPGSEYGEVCDSINGVAAGTGMRCPIGEPLLASENCVPAVAKALLAYACEVKDASGCAVFMAHGARHPAGRLFSRLAAELEKSGAGIYLASMSGKPLLQDVLTRLEGRKTWLFPLLSVAGLHVLRDMAGDNPHSWKSRVSAAGAPCIPVLRGLLEAPAFARQWLDNLGKAMNMLEQE